MKPRKEVVDFLHSTDSMPWVLTDGKWVQKTEKTAHHYGFVELKMLLDFIYEAEPVEVNEHLEKSKIFGNL